MITLALVVLIASILLRSAPGITALFSGTLLLGAAVTCGNVLLPGVIKRDFGKRAAPCWPSTPPESPWAPLRRGADRAVDAPQRMELAGGARVLGARRGGGTAPLAATDDGARAADAALLAPTYAGARQFYRDPLAWQVTAFFGLDSLVYNASSDLAAVAVRRSRHLPEQRRPAAGDREPHWHGDDLRGSGPGKPPANPRQSRRSHDGTARREPRRSALAPVGGALVWMVLFGLGQGAALGLALSLILLRSAERGACHRAVGHGTDLRLSAQRPRAGGARASSTSSPAAGPGRWPHCWSCSCPRSRRGSLPRAIATSCLTPAWGPTAAAAGFDAR